MILKFLLFPILKYDLGRKITISLNYYKLNVHVMGLLTKHLCEVTK